MSFAIPSPAAAAIVLLVAFSGSTQAQSLRCKNDLVNVGDSRSSVLLKCGEPVVKDAFCKPVAQPVIPNPAPGAAGVVVQACVNIDEWTYKPGYGQFVTTLSFEEGTLRSIKYGDRIK